MWFKVSMQLSLHMVQLEGTWKIHWLSYMLITYILKLKRRDGGMRGSKLESLCGPKKEKKNHIPINKKNPLAFSRLSLFLCHSTLLKQFNIQFICFEFLILTGKKCLSNKCFWRRMSVGNIQRMPHINRTKGEKQNTPPITS